MKKYVFILNLLTLFFLSCAKDEHMDKEPSLEVSIKDEAGNPLKGAVVLLYDNYHDWYEGTNPVEAGITNEAGEVLFEDLEEIVYYFDATYAEEWWNYPRGVYRTEQALQRGILRKIAVVVYNSVIN